MGAGKWAATGAALFAVVLGNGPARAMEIRQYDKMDDRDQAEYVQVLVDGAQRILKYEGRGDLARKMEQLFTEIPAGDKISLGMEEFEDNLALMRVNDAKHVIEHPTDPRLEVEDVMFLTMQKNHIDLPDSFFTVARVFKPKYSPATKPILPPRAAPPAVSHPKPDDDDDPIGSGGFISPPKSK